MSRLADRLGFKDKYTEGNTMEDWIRKIFNKSSLPQVRDLARSLRRRGTLWCLLPRGLTSERVSNRWYYEGRGMYVPDPGNPLIGPPKAKQMGTYRGK